jgi:cell division septal protein FtsQ
MEYNSPQDIREMKREQKAMKRKKQIRRRRAVLTAIGVLAIVIVVGFLYKWNVIPHGYYYNKDFGIEDYKSKQNA